VCFIQYLHQYLKMRGPFMIVAPLATIGHWKREVNNPKLSDFFADFDVFLFSDVLFRVFCCTARSSRGQICVCASTMTPTRAIRRVP
jgi:hypothetical protein